MEDLFKGLGPIAIFSAKRHWTAPRSVQLQRGPDGEGFGFSVRGNAPVIIAAVDHNSLADVSSRKGIFLFQSGVKMSMRSLLQLGGMKEGDFIVAISEEDVKWASHDQVVRLIKQCGDFINLKLVTPMDRNYLKVGRIFEIVIDNFWRMSKYTSLKICFQKPGKVSQHDKGSVSASSSSGVSSGHPSPAGSVTTAHVTKKLPWNPFKKSNVQRDSRDLTFDNVILR